FRTAIGNGAPCVMVNDAFSGALAHPGKASVVRSKSAGARRAITALVPLARRGLLYEHVERVLRLRGLSAASEPQPRAGRAGPTPRAATSHRYARSGACTRAR